MTDCRNPCKSLADAMTAEGFSCNWITRAFGATPTISGTWDVKSGRDLNVWMRVLRTWVAGQRCPMEMNYEVTMAMTKNTFSATITVTFKFPQERTIVVVNETSVLKKIEDMHMNVFDVYELMRRPDGLMNSNVRFIGSEINYGPVALTIGETRTLASVDTSQ